MTYPIFENFVTGERLYCVKNLNPEYPNNFYGKCIMEYYPDLSNDYFTKEFYYMEEMDSDNEILNGACKRFNLNKDEFELIGYTEYWGKLKWKPLKSAKKLILRKFLSIMQMYWSCYQWLFALLWITHINYHLSFTVLCGSFGLLWILQARITSYDSRYCR